MSDLEAVAGVALGATAVVAFGSAPAAVNVPAVNSSIFSGTTSITNTAGSLNVNVTNTTVPVAGSLTNNNAAPGANNVGVLGFIAETAYNTVTYTTGDQVLAVTDLHGAVNGDIQAVAGVQLGATAVVVFGGTVAAVNVPAVNSSLYAGTTGLTATGSSLNVNVTNSAPTAGTLTNNNAAPIADNVGVLGFIAESAYTNLTYTTGFQVLAATDLHGAIYNDMAAVAGVAIGATSVVAFGSAPAAVAVQAVNASLFSGTTPLTNTGGALNVAFSNTITTPLFVSGTLTNNNAAPAADNIGALIAVTNSGTFPVVTLPAYTAGDQELLRVSQGGSLVTIPADEEYQASISYFSDAPQPMVSIISTNTSRTPIFSIQTNSAAYNFTIRWCEFMAAGGTWYVELVKNGTLTGAAFTSTGIQTGSHVQRDTASTAVTGGVTVWSSYMGSIQTQPVQDLLQYALAGAPGDHFTLAVTKQTSGVQTIGGVIRWSEEAAAI
jgi:predicted hotdog family 3-hydroxylacyl-ACP dehydratase